MEGRFWPSNQGPSWTHCCPFLAGCGAVPDADAAWPCSAHYVRRVRALVGFGLLLWGSAVCWRRVGLWADFGPGASLTRCCPFLAGRGAVPDADAAWPCSAHYGRRVTALVGFGLLLWGSSIGLAIQRREGAGRLGASVTHPLPLSCTGCGAVHTTFSSCMETCLITCFQPMLSDRCRRPPAVHASVPL